MLRRVRFAAAGASSTNAALQSVLWEAKGGRTLRLVATDGRRLAMATGEIDLAVPVGAMSGDPLEIQFNPRLLSDALGVLDGEVRIDLEGPSAPAVLRAEGFLYLVMPMR